MSDFNSSKTLAGIGSLLVGFIIGIILFLIGMKGVSEYYKDERMYKGLVTAVIYLIIGFILSLVGIATVIILIGIPLIIVGFIFELLAARHIRDSLRVLSERSGEHLFETAGTIIWYGAILAIVGIGIFLMCIGFIIAAIGFFTLKETQSGASGTYQTPPPAYGYTPPPTTQPPTADAKSNFCPNCGTPVAPNATFCSHCGKQI